MEKEKEIESVVCTLQLPVVLFYTGQHWFQNVVSCFGIWSLLLPTILQKAILTASQIVQKHFSYSKQVKYQTGPLKHIAMVRFI